MLQFLSGHRLCDISSDLGQSLVHSVLQLNGWSMKDCLPLYTFPTLLFSSPLSFQGSSVVWQKSCRCHGAEQPHGVCVCRNSDKGQGICVRAASASKLFPWILSSPRWQNLYQAFIVLGSYVCTPFLRTLLLQPPPLCHSRCIHTSLAASRCGRNVAFIYEWNSQQPPSSFLSGLHWLSPTAGAGVRWLTGSLAILRGDGGNAKLKGQEDPAWRKPSLK